MSGAGPGPEPAREVALRPGYHSPQVEVDVRLNTNESPEPPPAAFLEALANELRALALNRYPDREALALRTALGALHGVGTDEVFCANGSNEVLQCLLLAYGGPGRAVMLFEPTYALHSHIARLVGSPVVAGGRDEAFRVEPGDIAATVARAAAEHGPGAPAVSFLCSPNNPTGTLESPQVVDALLRATSGIVVVDEAYGQFAPWSALELREKNPRLVVVRTFSKTWALAGLRLGYCVADPAVVRALSNVALPYHLDALKQAAGRVALGFDAEMRLRVAALVEERGRLAAALADLGVEYWQSHANFILFRAPGGDGTGLWKALLEQSVLVRDTSSWPGLESCLRVTVGTRRENDRFLAALAGALSARRGGA